MWEAQVLRTQSFQEAINKLCAGESAEALDRLTALRKDCSGDSHSEVELDRWIVRALGRGGKKAEAYVLLRNLEPQVKQFNYDLSLYYLEVVTLQQALGNADELHTYCELIKGHFQTREALGHLDWILQYVSSRNEARPSHFMYTILAVCAVQLGVDIPPRGMNGRAFRLTLEHLIDVREHSNNRYEAFLRCLHERHSGGSHANDVHGLIEQFVEHEPSPLFREAAQQAAQDFDEKEDMPEAD